MHRHAVIAASILSLAFLPAFAADPIRVPSGKVVLLDGRVSADEWADAAHVALGDFARMSVKESNGFVWIAVEFLKSDTGTLDLYLSNGDGRLYDLHASAKLGERVLTGAEWSNEWTWWNNQGWTANVSRVDSWEPRSFLNEKSREFQISRSRFPGREWRVMFELMSPGKPDWSTTTFPADARNTDATKWYVLRLSK